LTLRLDDWSNRDGGPLDDWYGRTGVEHHHFLDEALFSIAAGTWSSLYLHRDYLARPGSILMLMTADEWIVWQTFPEFPDEFRVWYVGQLDH